MKGITNNIYLVDFCIPHQLLNGVIRVEAIASKNLNGVGGHLIGDIPSKRLCNGCKVGVPAALVHFPGGPLVGHPSQLYLHCHISQHERNRLVLRRQALMLIPVDLLEFKMHVFSK